jgi:hypothetical protein
MTDTPAAPEPYVEPLNESDSARLQELAQDAGVELPEGGLDATQARRLLSQLEGEQSRAGQEAGEAT